MNANEYDGGYSITTEPEHRHYCALCGDIWGHQDEFCDGPKFYGYHINDFDCPFCVEK